LAAKCSISVRVDALSESDQVTIGLESRQKVEERIRQLEGRPMLAAAKDGGAKAKPVDVYHPPAAPVAAYNPAGDSVLDGAKKDKKDKKKKRDEESNGNAHAPKEKKKKKDK
jgi:nucleolar protein 58